MAHKSLDYANTYARLIESGKSTDYAHAFAYAVQSRALSARGGKEADYDKEQAARWNATYAEVFVEQQRTKGPEYSHIYASIVASGKSSEYAHSFTR